MATTSFSVEYLKLAQTAETMAKAAEQMATFSQNGSGEFGKAGDNLQNSDIRNVLLTYSDSWLPQLQVLASSFASISGTLTKAVALYIKTEEANAQKLNPG